MLRSIIQSFILLIVLLPPVLCPAAEDKSLTLKLDRAEATLVDTITMVVSVSDAKSGDALPVIKGMKSFNVTPIGASSHFDIIQAKGKIRVDFTYVIQPKKSGVFNLGPAEIAFQGKTVKSNTEILTVTGKTKVSSMDQDTLFLTASLSPNKVYVEHQSIYTLKLFSQVKFRAPSLSLPQQDDITFWQLGQSSRYQRIYNGQSYKVLDIRFSFMPSKVGIYEVEPSKIHLTVSPAGNASVRGFIHNPSFDDPFFTYSKGFPMTLASKSLVLEVLPLPEKGRPANFSGLVGDFKIRSSLKPTEIKAEESATLTVIIEGQGNFRRIPDLTIPKIEELEVYAHEPVMNEKTVTKFKTASTGMTGSKSIKWTLIPEKEGPYRIPPLAVSFFDTRNHCYQTIKTDSITLSARPNGNKARPATTPKLEQGDEGISINSVKELGYDILPIHTALNDVIDSSRFRLQSLTPLVVLFAPLFVYATTFFGIKLRSRSLNSRAETRAKKAALTFKQKYNQCISNPDNLTLLIRDYLNDRYGLSLGSPTPAEIFEILQSNGVSTETAERLQKLVQSFEEAIYQGKAERPFDIQKDILRLIKQIEKEMR